MASKVPARAAALTHEALCEREDGTDKTVVARSSSNWVFSLNMYSLGRGSRSRHFSRIRYKRPQDRNKSSTLCLFGSKQASTTSTPRENQFLTDASRYLVAIACYLEIKAISPTMMRFAISHSIDVVEKRDQRRNAHSRYPHA